MKTLNFILAAAVISVSFVSCQKDDIVPQKPADNSRIAKVDNKTGKNTNIKMVPEAKMGNQLSYIVTIHLKYEKPLCNRYLVKLIDGDGREIAAPVNYDPNTSVYTFRESTYASSGVRMARLDVVVYPGEHFVCAQEFTTDPEIKTLAFKNGDSFTFDLYPKAMGLQNNESDMPKE